MLKVLKLGKVFDFELERQFHHAAFRQLNVPSVTIILWLFFLSFLY